MKKSRAVLAIEYPIETVMLRALFGVLAVLVFSYLYFVSASVLNIIAQREARSQATSLTTAIGNVEHEYFVLSGTVTPESGVSLGLAPVSSVAYVYRPGVVGKVEVERNEI